MNMQVEYCLAGIVAYVYSYVETVRLVFLLKQLFRLVEKVVYCKYLFVCCLEEICEMPFGNYKHVSLVYGVAVEECKCQVVFKLYFYAFALTEYAFHYVSPLYLFLK